MLYRPVLALLSKLLTHALHLFFASCICRNFGNPPKAALFPLAEVPGLACKHLAAQLDNKSGLLIISGSYPTDPATSTTEPILQECRDEEFRREFRLPKDVAFEGISAKLDNGELTGEHPLRGSSRHCLDCVWSVPLVRSLGQPAVHSVSHAFHILSEQLLRLQMLCQLCGTLFPRKSLCFPISPSTTTSPTHTLPAVSLPKVAKPELTTMTLLSDDNIPLKAYDASAPTKPDAAAPRISTDREATPMEDHEVIV